MSFFWSQWVQEFQSRTLGYGRRGWQITKRRGKVDRIASRLGGGLWKFQKLLRFPMTIGSLHAASKVVIFGVVVVAAAVVFDAFTEAARRHSAWTWQTLSPALPSFRLFLVLVGTQLLVHRLDWLGHGVCDCFV